MTQKIASELRDSMKLVVILLEMVNLLKLLVDLSRGARDY